MKSVNHRPTRTRRVSKHLDLLIASPLARFRRELGRLSVDELHALLGRIDVLSVGARWARGSHGLARHGARNQLGRLARRETAIHRELAARRGSPTPISLHEVTAPRTLAVQTPEQQAA
jgi:hypothetical protein